jgi:sugar fermentation stimulation protein A
MIRFPFNRGQILKAAFVERPNRFLIRCIARGFGPIDAYLPNPGRLWELLLPGAPLYVHPDSDKGGNFPSRRSTGFTVLAAQRQGFPVFLHTHLTNHVARFLIEKGLIPELKGAEVVRTEVPAGKSRLDLLLRQNRSNVYLEVKSCTLFGNGVAMFPDAITERGRKHLLELAKLGGAGIRTAVLFVVHYPKVHWFMPDFHTDFDFSTTLLNVKDDLQILPVAIGWNPDLTIRPEVKTLEIPWDYLRSEVRDTGAYLLVLRLTREMPLQIGQLGRLTFKKGYYIYVGSAMNNLTARIKRHSQKRKKMHWHIDYLTDHTSEIVPLPIRSSRRDECEVAKDLSSIMEKGPSGFGSSDCSCHTHLFFSETNPLHTRRFHDVLQRFRMRHP